MNIFLEVDDFGQGLCLWNMMSVFVSSASSIPAATQPWPFVSGELSLHNTTNCLSLLFLDTLAALGQKQRAEQRAWNSRSLPELTWKQASLLPVSSSPLFLQVERQLVGMYLHLIALECEVGGGESSHTAKLLQWLFSALFPLWCQFSNGKYFMCHHKPEILQSYRTLLLKAVVK